MPAPRLGHPRVRLRASGTPSLAAGFNVVTWATADYDDVGLWDSATAVILDRPGLWLMDAYVSAGTTAAGKVLRVHWSINGVAGTDCNATSTTSSTFVRNFRILELAGGDVLTLHVQRSDTGTSTLNGADTYCEVIRIGPVRYTG